MPFPTEIEKGHFEFITPNILMFTVTKPIPNKDDVLEYEQAFIAHMKMIQGRVLMIYDASLTEWANLETRTTLGQVVNSLDSVYFNKVECSHIIVPTLTTKLILQGVNIVAKPIVKQIVYSKRSAAMKDAHDKVDAWTEAYRLEV